MTKRFTYKELTLIIGVVVAVIVVFTLWIRQPLSAYLPTSHASGSIEIRKVTRTPLKNYFNAFEELLSGQNNPY
jgi:hypothetical protein